MTQKKTTDIQISLRLSNEMYDLLKEEAGVIPLATYIRNLLDLRLKAKKS